MDKGPRVRGQPAHCARVAVIRLLVAGRAGGLLEDQAVRAAADAMHDVYVGELSAAREAAEVAHDQFVDTAAGCLARTV